MDSLTLDNPVFNVKGQGRDMLLAALTLGINCVGKYTFKGFRIDNKKGIVLYWADSDKEGYQQFMIPSKPEGVVDQIFQAISTINIEISDDEDVYWDKPHDDDEVDNDLGWRLYTEERGEIDNEWEACLAIVPSYLCLSK